MDGFWIVFRAVTICSSILKKLQTVPVPHPKKDLPFGTVRAIKKLAGLV